MLKKTSIKNRKILYGHVYSTFSDKKPKFSHILRKGGDRSESHFLRKARLMLPNIYIHIYRIYADADRVKGKAITGGRNGNIPWMYP